MNVKTALRAQWDRAAAAALVLLGALVLLLGWFGVSGEGVAAKQIPYIISGGIGGVFLLGVAAVLWLSADLRDEWRVLEEIRIALVSAPDEAGPDLSAPLTATSRLVDAAPRRRARPTVARTASEPAG